MTIFCWSSYRSFWVATGRCLTHRSRALSREGLFRTGLDPPAGMRAFPLRVSAGGGLATLAAGGPSVAERPPTHVVAASPSRLPVAWWLSCLY